MIKRPYNKEYYDNQPKYQGANNTIAKGGQIAAIAHKGKEVVKLFELFCLRHPVHDFERSNPNYRATKIMPIKMEQGIIEEDTKEGRNMDILNNVLNVFKQLRKENM